MPSVAATDRIHPYMMQLLLAFSIHRHPSSILRRARFPLGTAFARHGSRALQRNPGNLRRPRFTKCRPLPRDLAVASVHNAAALGSKAHRPPSSILCRTRCLPGRHFHGMGPGEFRDTQEMSSLTKCRLLPRRTGSIRP